MDDRLLEQALPPITCVLVPFDLSIDVSLYNALVSAVPWVAVILPLCDDVELGWAIVRIPLLTISILRDYQVTLAILLAFFM